MTPEIIVAVIGLAGSGIGAFAGILISAKLTNFRIEQLEKKVDKHNSVINRTYILEEQVRCINNDIEEIKKKGK